MLTNFIKKHVGCGIGIMLQASLNSFNDYFVKKRFLMMSIEQTLIGLGVVAHPVIVHYLMTQYGFRGMMLIIAALNFHTIFGMICMHKVKWHYKITKIPIDESQFRKSFLII